MKYWKALTAAAMLLGLSACGGGSGDDDKNDPPPPKPGDAGSVVFSAKAPEFIEVADAASATKGTVEKLAVDFTLKDSQGNPVDVGTQVLSFSVTKLIPGRTATSTESGEAFSGPTIWKAFTYSSPTDPMKAKATFEKSDGTYGTLENLGNGSYRYIFKTDFKNTQDPYADDSAGNGGLIAWDADKTHRLAVTFGSNEEGSVMPLVNYTLDWVPAGGSPVLTRDILELESCNDCHMGQPIHHSSRNDPKVCVACHNDSNPTNTGRKTLAVLAHDFHSANKTPKGANYPQDPRNCDTCHKPVTASTPDANNWTVPTEATCKSCHADYASPVKEHHTGADCNSCHSDDLAINPDHAKAGVTNVHMGRLNAMHKGADTLKLDIKSARYDAATKAVTVELNISKDGVGINDIATELKPFTYMDGGLLVNLNEGEGNVLPISGKNIKLNDCTSMGSGNFSCVTQPIFKDERVPASNAVLVVTIADMGLCADKNALDPGASGTPALKPCPVDSNGAVDMAKIGGDRFEYITPPNVPVAQFDLGGTPVSGDTTPVGADKALCSNCHANFEIHLSGSKYDHAARDFNQCASCHNSERASHYAQMPGDLKYHVHSYHKVGSHRPAEEASPFPGKVSNCESCHTKEQYNLPNQQNARPSLVGTTAENTEPKYFSPTLVVCSSCHLKSPLGAVNPDSPVAGDEWASHMKDNGAVFGAATMEAATGTEQCASCHAVGQEQGVDKVHKVYDFR